MGGPGEPPDPVPGGQRQEKVVLPRRSQEEQGGPSPWEGVAARPQPWVFWGVPEPEVLWGAVHGLSQLGMELGPGLGRADAAALLPLSSLLP